MYFCELLRAATGALLGERKLFTHHALLIPCLMGGERHLGSADAGIFRDNL